MSRKKKKRRGSSRIKPVKKVVEMQSPLAEEVANITNKVHEEESVIYELEKKKRQLTESLVDKILLNNELKTLINQYCLTSKELDEREKTQENRKKDLEYKQSKLTEENKTVLKEITEYLTIEDSESPVGLYNTICKSPVAKCLQKNVYLSYSDVRYKGCLKHRDHRPCRHLEWLSYNDDIFKGG